MKQFFKMFFASFLAVIIASVVVVGLVIGGLVSAVKSSKTVAPEEEGSTTGQVLVMDLTDGLHEQGEQSSLPFGGDAFRPGLYETVKALEEAATDDGVRTLLLKTGGTPLDWATATALRDAVLQFRKSGKRVYAYGENVTQRDYYLASAADSVFLNPVGNFDWKGLSSELLFVKGTLDNLEIQPEIFYAGRFKSATEPLREKQMSPASRQQLAALQADVWSTLLEAAAAHAETDTATAAGWARTGAVQFPQDALALRLVDGLRYWDEVEDVLRARTGTDSGKKITYRTVKKYASAPGSTAEKSRVAVLFAEGSIVDGKQTDDYQIASETFIKSIRKVRDADAVKAVVLRVNSPGGSALASEVILRELELLNAKKPLVVSMGDVAASGGYYIASGADSIFAEPTTITGSIGVFTVLFNVEGFLRDKLGVTTDAEKNAPYADFPTGTRALTADEGARVQRSVDTIYAIFKRRVAEGRRIDIVQVDSLAQGRVYSGTDALQLRLVDGLGGLNRAIASATRLAKLKEGDYGVATYPAPVDNFESILRRMGANSDAAAGAALRAALVQEFGADFPLLKKVQALRAMAGKAQAALPFVPVIQ